MEVGLGVFVETIRGMLVAVMVGVVSGIGLIVAVGVVVGVGEETAVFVAVTTATRVRAIVACMVSGAHPAIKITKPSTNRIFNCIWFMLASQNDIRSSMRLSVFVGNENNVSSLYGLKVSSLR